MEVTETLQQRDWMMDPEVVLKWVCQGLNLARCLLAM